MIRLLLFLLINSIVLAIDFDGSLETKIELQEKEKKYTLLLGEIYPKVPKNAELFFNFENSIIDNERAFILEENKEKTALGLKYSYYGITGVSLGVKGSLENNHFFEEYKNSFNFKKFKYDEAEDKKEKEDTYYQSYSDFGLKFYGEAVYKTKKRLVFTLWNEMTLDKLESNLPKAHETIEPTVTVTPKIIYEKPILENSKLLTEIFVENRKYINRKIDLEGRKKDFYSKFVITQHLIFDEKIGENWSFKGNNSLTYEQIDGNKNGQLILKISPRLNYSKENIEFSITGGEFRFQEEMGMTYDYYELYGYKLVGKPDIKKLKFEDYWKFQSDCFSVKSDFKYKFMENYSLGGTLSYRKGNYIEYISDLKSNSAFLIEKGYRAFAEYEKKLQNRVTIDGLMYYEKKAYEENLIIKLDDREDFGIKLSLKYDL